MGSTIFTAGWIQSVNIKFIWTAIGASHEYEYIIMFIAIANGFRVTVCFLRAK